MKKGYYYTIEYEIRPHIWAIVSYFKYLEQLHAAWQELENSPEEHKERYRQGFYYKGRLSQ